MTTETRCPHAYEQGKADRRKWGNLAPCPYAEGSPEQDAWYEGWLGERHTPPAATFRDVERKHGAVVARALNPHPDGSERAERYDYEARDFMDEKD